MSTSLEHAQRQLLLALARHTLGIGTAASPMEIHRLIAMVDAPVVLVCRKHGNPFSSASPCATCAAEANKPIAFGMDLVEKETHVVLAGGKTTCGLDAAGLKPSATPSGHVCPLCYERAPGGVWSAVFEVAA